MRERVGPTVNSLIKCLTHSLTQVVLTSLRQSEIFMLSPDDLSRMSKRTTPK